MRGLGVQIERKDKEVLIEGRGLAGLCAASSPLDCGRSGTTLRLLAGLLSAAGLPAVLQAHPQLRARPMRRILEPLQSMGAVIDSDGGRAPLRLHAHQEPLRGLVHDNQLGSAQVKSALLLAGLGASTAVVVRESRVSRRHTERMLAAMGAPIEITQDSVTLHGPFDRLQPFDFVLPSDPSSAAIFVALSVLLPESELLLEDLLHAEERAGFVRALQSMGAKIEAQPRRQLFGEAVCDLHCRSSKLRGIQVGPAQVPSMIDELPLLGLAMCLADGPSELRGAGDLRSKESDRITTTVKTLRGFGAEIEELEDGWRCPGGSRLRGAALSSSGDHRVAMLATAAAALATGESRVGAADCIADSYAGFLPDLQSLGLQVRAISSGS